MTSPISEIDEELIAKEVTYVFDDPEMSGQRPRVFNREEYERCIRMIKIRYPQHSISRSSYIAWHTLSIDDAEFFKEIGFKRSK
eukprot:763106-Hanusia_phi.AAC.3